MSKLRDLYQKQKAEKLLEARVSLLQKGIYPFDVFLKETKETNYAATQISKLEEVADLHKTTVPTLFLFLKENAEVLMEAKTNPEAVESAMVNYAFLSEAIGKCVKEAVSLLSTKNKASSSLKAIYGKDAVKLMEFCIQRAEAHKLMEGDTSAIISHLAGELSNLPLSELSSLCESVPAIRLYVSNKVHKQLADIIVG